MTEKPTDEALEFADQTTRESGADSIRTLRQYRQWADEQLKAKDVTIKDLDTMNNHLGRRNNELHADRNAARDVHRQLRDVCKRRDGQLADAAQQLERAESQRDDAVAERDRARKVADGVLLGVANTSHAKKLLDAEAAVAAYKRENESLTAQLAKQRRMVADQDRQEEKLRRTLTDTRTELRRTIANHDAQEEKLRDELAKSRAGNRRLMRERDNRRLMRERDESPAVTKMRDLSESLDAMGKKRTAADKIREAMSEAAEKIIETLN